MRVGTGIKLLTSFASEGATGWATNLHLEAEQWAKSGPQFVYIWISCQKWNLPPPEAPSASSFPPSPFWVQKIISFLLQKTSLQPYRLSCTRKDLRLREKKTETQRRNRTKHQVIISIKTGMIKIMICMKICFSFFFFSQRLQLDLDALQNMSNNTYKCFSCNYWPILMKTLRCYVAV